MNSVENPFVGLQKLLMFGDGMDLELRYYLYSMVVLCKMHYINSSDFISLTMLFLCFFICIPVRYHISICVASVLKGSPHPSLPLRCMLSSLLTAGWCPAALPVCMTTYLRPCHVFLGGNLDCPSVKINQKVHTLNFSCFCLTGQL